LKSSESRQLGVVFADNSKESEPDPKPDESIGRSYLLHTADDNLTSETDASVDDQDTCHDRLLERVASLPNLARALLFVARNKGAAGVDGISTEEIVEAAPDLLPKIREALITGTYQPGDICRARVTQVLNWLNRVEFNSGLLVDFFTAANPIEHSLGMTIKCRR
jgi:RNA-directed DNA polymerase